MGLWNGKFALLEIIVTHAYNIDNDQVATFSEQPSLLPSPCGQPFLEGSQDAGGDDDGDYGGNRSETLLSQGLQANQCNFSNNMLLKADEDVIVLNFLLNIYFLNLID